MKYKIYAILVAMVTFLIVLNSDSYAGNRKKAGAADAPELLIPIGARDLALGGSSIGTTRGIEAMFWNPAGLARSAYSADAIFSRLDYLAGIDLNYVAVAGKFGNLGSVGFSIKSLALGDIPVTTEDAPDGTGATIEPTFLIVGLSYSKIVNDRVSVGFNVNVISESFPEVNVSATGVSFTGGLQYTGLAGLEGLTLGVVVRNIGPQMGFSGSGLLRQGTTADVTRGETFVKIDAATDELPSTFEIGASYTVNAGELNKLEFSGMFVNNNFSDDEARFGVEYGYNDTFFLRGGFSDAPDALTNTFIFGATLGAGVRFKTGGIDIEADYGWMQTDLFNNINAFSLKLGF